MENKKCSAFVHHNSQPFDRTNIKICIVGQLIALLLDFEVRHCIFFVNVFSPVMHAAFHCSYLKKTKLILP